MGGVYPCQEQRDLQNESRIDWMLSKKYLATPCTSISCYTISCYAIFYSVRLKSSFKEQSSLALVFAMRMSLYNVQSSLADLLETLALVHSQTVKGISRGLSGDSWYERMNSTDTSVQDLVVLVCLASIKSIQFSRSRFLPLLLIVLAFRIYLWVPSTQTLTPTHLFAQDLYILSPCVSWQMHEKNIVIELLEASQNKLYMRITKYEFLIFLHPSYTSSFFYIQQRVNSYSPNPSGNQLGTQTRLWTPSSSIITNGHYNSLPP